MKKLFLVSLLIFACASLLLLSGCTLTPDNDDADSAELLQHEHSYGEWQLFTEGEDLALGIIDGSAVGTIDGKTVNPAKQPLLDVKVHLDSPCCILSSV